MATREEPTVELKVFVDNEKSRVLFAESGKEFVDVLFGFLTLPLGTVVRLIGKQSQIGCLDELYSSVEGLPTSFFRTEACKTMLLKPINAAARQCCQLKVRIDDTRHREANDGVLPLSLASTLQVITEAKIQRKDLVEKELTLTKIQVMELLRAALVTRKALTAVLLPPNNMKKLHPHSFGLY